MPSPGTCVVLQCFNGTTEGPQDRAPSDDYWRLIGSTGVVLEPANAQGRVLVRFDEDVAALGLAGHNPVPNSLLIAASDLAAIT
ncbi:hypothetical protein HNP48_003459 [Acidovorax soli]|uniref:Uncharacterized protein n=1 Tax=Acidovorax soli TaxID=592050 RepID=A0A7X0PF79_9BURK|nr:hypothetical protein [Acidovorax soli]MBB6560783.1 hypothetical protein [Acidovorax soli]